jgi:nucleoside-diphosphate-sugar epimerase
MTSTSPLHVVLGASGGAGNAIARALHEAGLTTRAVNRSGSADLPEGIETVAADVTDPAGAARAVAGADVIYMAAQPPYHRWPEEFPAMLDTVIDAGAGAGAKLVMVDNLYGYGPGAGTMTETTPERATDSKGSVRRAMTERLLDVHRSGRLRVAIGRASDYFGPRADNSAITALAVEPVVAAKTIRWTGSLDAPHSVAYLPDIARAHVQLGTDGRADGRIWILPHAPAVTGAEFLRLVNAALPTPLKTGVISTTMLRLASPFHRISKETLGIVYQWTEPFVVDDAAFHSTFGPFTTTPLETAVAETVAWYRRDHHRP